MSVYWARPRGQINYVLFSDYPLVKKTGVAQLRNETMRWSKYSKN